MFDQIKHNLILASSTVQFKVAVQIILISLLLITAFAAPEAALAKPSWGSMGG